MPALNRGFAALTAQSRSHVGNRLTLWDTWPYTEEGRHGGNPRNMSLERVWEIFDRELPFIDGILAKSNVPIHRRPLDAAFMFVEECIVEVQGMTKEEFIQGWWFGDVLRHAREWFIARYGAKPVNEHETSSPAIIELFHTPFLALIPLTISKFNDETGLIELTFPIAVLADEDPFSWLTSPPNVDAIPVDKAGALNDQLRETGTLVRKVEVALQTASFADDASKGMAEGVKASLEKGVEDVCSMREDRQSIAVWEFCFAVEKALKAYVLVKGGKLKYTHDIPTLIDDAVALGLGRPDQSLIASFPPPNQVMNYRYGQATPPNVGTLTEMYVAALRLCLHCLSALPHALTFGGDGATFYLKPFPWAQQDRKPLESQTRSDDATNGAS